MEQVTLGPFPAPAVFPILPHLDQTWQHNLKPHMLIAFVLSLFVSDICFLHFLRRRLRYSEAQLIYNEPCLFACLFLFFLIRVLLHPDPQVQSDIANFLPCLPIPQHMKVLQDYREHLQMGPDQLKQTWDQQKLMLRYPLVLEQRESRDVTLICLFGAEGEKYSPY